MKAGRTTEEHLSVLMNILGHQFNDSYLLKCALTHSSLSGDEKIFTPSNERLEFIGDRVLGLVIAELLLQLFPKENEGDLSRRHADLVRMETLGKVGSTLDLGKYIHMSRGEERMRGRNHPALLADVCEAVIAALYMDGGLNIAAEFIRNNWQPFIEKNPLPPKDSKTNLQEWAQKQGLPVPKYSEIERHGPAHDPIFTVEVEVLGQISLTGSGQSKRAAQQKAAENMLKNLICAKS